MVSLLPGLVCEGEVSGALACGGGASSSTSGVVGLLVETLVGCGGICIVTLGGRKSHGYYSIKLSPINDSNSSSIFLDCKRVLFHSELSRPVNCTMVILDSVPCGLFCIIDLFVCVDMFLLARAVKKYLPPFK
jgi:hypothetical protein